MQLENFETIEKLLDRVERLALKAGSGKAPATERLLIKIKILSTAHISDLSDSIALYGTNPSDNILWSEIVAIIKE
jgi:hypothetical protein